jgi:hypothetical protein
MQDKKCMEGQLIPVGMTCWPTFFIASLSPPQLPDTCVPLFLGSRWCPLLHHQWATLWRACHSCCTHALLSRMLVSHLPDCCPCFAAGDVLGIGNSTIDWSSFSEKPCPNLYKRGPPSCLYYTSRSLTIPQPSSFLSKSPWPHKSHHAPTFSSPTLLSSP